MVLSLALNLAHVKFIEHQGARSGVEGPVAEQPLAARGGTVLMRNPFHSRLLTAKTPVLVSELN